MKKYLLLSIVCIASLVANAANKHYALSGTLGQDIDFRLDLEEDPYHGIVMGQTTYYRKNGKTSKIKVYGTSRNLKDADESLHLFMLSEFNGTKVCGTFDIALEPDGTFNYGSWSLGEKAYDMNNVMFLSTDYAPKFFKPVNIADASGVYKFSYNSGNPEMPEYGGTLQLYAHRDNVAYEVCQVTPNIAEASGKMAEIFENRFYFSVEDAHYDVQTFEDVAFVIRANPLSGHPDSFGAFADVEGCYIATDEEPEGEIMNSFDEEMAFLGENKFSVFDMNTIWMEVFGGETTFPDEIIMKDIDGDGKEEVIARYTENKTSDYEVPENRYAIFLLNDEELSLVDKAQGKLEDLEIADGYVIKNEKNSRNSLITHTYSKIQNGVVTLHATKSEAEISSFTIEENTVKEKDFKKQIKINKVIKVTDLDGWKEVPGNIHRNETAARG